MKFEKNDPRLIPDPPPWFTQAQRIAYYQKDLEIAFGAEFIQKPPPELNPIPLEIPHRLYKLDPKKRFPNSKPISTQEDVGFQELLEKIHGPPSSARHHR